MPFQGKDITDKPYSRYPNRHPEARAQGHMPPPSGDVAQTPESRTTGGLANVFRSLTGNRLARTPLPATQPHPSPTVASLQIAQELNTPRGGVYGGPLEYEHLHGQLKNGKTLADRRSAADTLRLALADYSLDGVCLIRICY